MPHIDTKKKQINCKIVYYGTGMGGKTTNLKAIHEKTDPKKRGKLISLATETERTLFFDFVPLAFGNVAGLATRFHFYTVPGQSFYNLSRKAILKSVDGLVFVADSRTIRHEANIDSFMNLQENLSDYNYQLEKIPHVIQYNKRDLDDLVPVEQMRQDLNPFGAKDFEVIATQGIGVVESMNTVVEMVMAKLKSELETGRASKGA